MVLFFLLICIKLFLDIFSYASLGISMVLLMAIAFLIKKTQSLLKEEKNWNLKNFAIILLASLIPFGTFWVDKKYLS
jgi:cell shape-determining protein MreD